jgi:DNA-directed RNA polymerase specialized sigma24 family protein
MSQVEQYVRKARPQTAAAILIKIHSIYNLGELSQRPLLLEMIVKSIDKLSASEVNPAQLYEAFTGAWVHRDLWRDLMRPEDKLKFLTALSRTLWEQEKTSIEYQKLEAYVGTELATLVDSPQKLIELDGEIRTASFLVRDDRGQYGFAHSSYAEYFLAKYLADGISAGYVRVLTIRRLTNEVIDFLLWMTDKSRLEEMLTGVLTKEYQPLLSENALLILYRLRRRLLVEEMGRVSDTSKLQVEMPRAMRLGGAKLSQINLEGAIIHDACLDGADLRQCIAVGADLTGSSLADAAVTKGDLQGACLREAKAAGAILTEVNLHGADATKCDFSRADLTGSILTIKQSSGAVFKDAILTAVVLSPDSGISARPQETGPPHSSDWDRERALKQAFGFARRFAARIGAGANSEDIASDVVVYLLSNPTELARLSQPKFNPESICRALVWRRVSTLQREEPLSSTRLRPIGESDFMGEDEDIPDHYRIDILTGQETPSDAGERPDSEYEPETNDIELDTIADSLPSPEETDSIFQEHLENADLIDVLGKFLSEAALKMLIARYVEEETIEEIAKTYGLSDVEVVRRLNMARELARRALRPV